MSSYSCFPSWTDHDSPVTEKQLTLGQQPCPDMMSKRQGLPTERSLPCSSSKHFFSKLFLLRCRCLRKPTNGKKKPPVHDRMRTMVLSMHFPSWFLYTLSWFSPGPVQLYRYRSGLTYFLHLDHKLFRGTSEETSRRPFFLRRSWALRFLKEFSSTLWQPDYWLGFPQRSELVLYSSAMSLAWQKVAERWQCKLVLL